MYMYIYIIVYMYVCICIYIYIQILMSPLLQICRRVSGLDELAMGTGPPPPANIQQQHDEQVQCLALALYIPWLVSYSCPLTNQKPPFCRVPIDFIYGFHVRNLQNSGFWLVKVYTNPGHRFTDPFRVGMEASRRGLPGLVVLYLGSHVAQNKGPLHPRAAQNPWKVTHKCGPLPLQAMDDQHTAYVAEPSMFMQF